MTLKVFVFAFLVSLHAQALQLQVIGKNHEILFQKQLMGGLPKSVESITVMAFEAYSVPYAGNPNGIFSIYGLSSELEIISADEQRLYGWCYSIDGYIPNALGKDLYIHKEKATLTWFYAYTHFKNKAVIEKCVPHGQQTQIEQVQI